MASFNRCTWNDCNLIGRIMWPQSSGGWVFGACFSEIFQVCFCPNGDFKVNTQSKTAFLSGITVSQKIKFQLPEMLKHCREVQIYLTCKTIGHATTKLSIMAVPDIGAITTVK